MLDNKGWVGW